jgi:hypothetical protein
MTEVPTEEVKTQATEVTVSRSDETSSRSDHGFWQKFKNKILYYKDGKKRTINKKTVSITLLSTFPFVLVLLWIRDLRQSQSDTASAPSEVGLPGQLIQGKTIEIPPLANLDQAAPGTSRAFLQGGGNGTRGLRAGKDPLYSGTQVISRNTGPKKIPPGLLLNAKLVTGASNGPVKAEATDDLSLNGETFVPAGTILNGAGHSTEERLFIHFNQMVLADGTTQTISADAIEMSDKIAGLKGSKVSHVAARIAAGIGLNFVGGMTDALQDSTALNGAVIRAPSMKNALLNGSERATFDEATQMMNGIKNTQPIIEVPPETPIMLLFTEAQS